MSVCVVPALRFASVSGGVADWCIPNMMWLWLPFLSPIKRWLFGSGWIPYICKRQRVRTFFEENCCAALICSRQNEAGGNIFTWQKRSQRVSRSIQNLDLRYVFFIDDDLMHHQAIPQVIVANTHWKIVRRNWSRREARAP